MSDTSLISPLEAETALIISEITRAEYETVSAALEAILESEQATLKCLSPDLGLTHG